jgi:hypothetical protein
VQVLSHLIFSWEVVMKVLTSLAAAIAMAVSMSTVSAAELKSGPQSGDDVGPYYVTKVAGNPTDGV